MAVSLYTSRVVLGELGVSDYGIYSIVGGFVGLFSFLNIAMTSATQRYLTIDIGRNDYEALKKTFSATLTIHIGISLLVLILAETIGLWYINYKLVFPPERVSAVNIVYQFSIAATLLGIIQVPYNSLIIAHEKMEIYAFVGIAEVVLKLLIVFILLYFGSDKLVVYSVLTFIVAFGIRLFYQIYCRKNYKESIYVFKWDVTYYKELLAYSSWNLLGNLAAVAKGQGSNMVLNFFYGTTVNAAYGIMSTVNGAVNGFVSSFLMATNPQIIKLYAEGQMRSMEKLINQTTKFSYFLSLILMAPILLNIEFILEIWLRRFPQYTADFIRIILLCSLVDILTKPIMTGITATGKIKAYHIVIGLFNLLIVPTSYFIIKFGNNSSPIIILYIWLAFSILSLVLRLVFVRLLLKYNINEFFYKVLLPCSVVSGFSYFVGVLFHNLYPKVSLSIFIIETVILIIILLSGIFIFGMTKQDRLILVTSCKNVWDKFSTIK